MKRFALRSQRGSAMIEYMVVATFLVIVLVANPNVIKQLADALRDVYASFVYTISASWF